MKVYKGKWYFVVRFSNDACFGIGRAPEWMKRAALRNRPHVGV